MLVLVRIVALHHPDGRPRSLDVFISQSFQHETFMRQANRIHFTHHWLLVSQINENYGPVLNRWSHAITLRMDDASLSFRHAQIMQHDFWQRETAFHKRLIVEMSVPARSVYVEYRYKEIFVF